MLLEMTHVSAQKGPHVHVGDRLSEGGTPVRRQCSPGCGDPGFLCRPAECSELVSFVMTNFQSSLLGFNIGFFLFFF